MDPLFQPEMPDSTMRLECARLVQMLSADATDLAKQAKIVFDFVKSGTVPS